MRERRLYLIRTLLSNPNFLLFDEPTNDLDLQTLAMLEEYLLNFPGCLLLVSHDRYFLDKITDFQFIFDGEGGINGFAGNYTEFKDMQIQESKTELAVKAESKQDSGRMVKRERKLSFKEKREYESMEEKILDLESRIEEKEKAFASPDFSPEQAAELTSAYEALKSELETLYARWEELSALAGD